MDVFLEVDDVADIVEAVPHVNNWEELGLALRMKPPDLEAIRNDNRDTSSCRREMIKKWLKMGNGSWKALCIALAKDHVGHINLAKRIAEDHRVKNIKEPTQASDNHPGKLLSGMEGKHSIPSKVRMDSITPNPALEHRQYSHPELVTPEGNTETGAFSSTSQIYPDSVDET